MQKRNLYLFDFDGTLTRVDTLFDFLKFSFPDTYFSKYVSFIPLFILAKMNLAEAGKVKEKFISSFLKGKSKDEISSLARKYFDVRSSEILRKNGIEYIQQIPDYYDKYIVSASVDIWLIPFADYLNVGLICTKSDFNQSGIFTGSFASPNCNYEEKKRRIELEIDMKKYDSIFAFGDSKGDEQMFSLAQNVYFKHF